MTYAYTVQKVKNIANVSTDRIIELKPIAAGRTGMVDRRLFTGGNKLHAVQDAGLWYVKYDDGAVPPVLKQRWTNFNQLMKFVTNYFKGRNVEVKEVIS